MRTEGIEHDTKTIGFDITKTKEIRNHLESEFHLYLKKLLFMENNA